MLQNVKQCFIFEKEIFNRNKRQSQFQNWKFLWWFRAEVGPFWKKWKFNCDLWVVTLECRKSWKEFNEDVKWLNSSTITGRNCTYLFLNDLNQLELLLTKYFSTALWWNIIVVRGIMWKDFLWFHINELYLTEWDYFTYQVIN